jgi:hypothetical protein
MIELIQPLVDRVVGDLGFASNHAISGIVQTFFGASPSGVDAVGCSGLRFFQPRLTIEFVLLGPFRPISIALDQIELLINAWILVRMLCSVSRSPAFYASSAFWL